MSDTGYYPPAPVEVDHLLPESEYPELQALLWRLEKIRKLEDRDWRRGLTELPLFVARPDDGGRSAAALAEISEFAEEDEMDPERFDQIIESVETRMSAIYEDVERNPEEYS